MISPVSVLRYLAWMLLALAGSVVAQEEVPLTKISEVLALDGRDAGANPRPVRLKGVVLGVSTMFSFFSSRSLSVSQAQKALASCKVTPTTGWSLRGRDNAWIRRKR